MSGHILELSENVNRKTVVYKNRYGMDIAGELYYEKNIDFYDRRDRIPFEKLSRFFHENM